ncbi:MAG: SurA N-terminal domain-containing protein [Deltaproteobacteria bacterium]|nr:SurA N-terminal domain-containing protein [Deltaproteobacteria bacterium]
MKKILLFVFLCVSLTVSAKIVDRIAAVVNQEVITQSDVDRAMAMMIAAAKKKPSAEESNRLYADVLQNLIDQKILEIEIAKSEIEVTPTELSGSIAGVLQNNQMTLEQLQAELAERGSSFASFKEELKKQIQQSKFIQQQVSPSVQVTEQDVEKYRRTHRLSVDQEQTAEVAVVFLPISTNASSKERKEKVLTARRLAEEIRRTGFLETLTEQVKKEGGSLQEQQKRAIADLPAALIQTVRNMQIGATTDPIADSSGVYIVKLFERSIGATKGEAAWSDDQIYQRLYNERMQEAIQGYLLRLRRKAFVDIRP